jgi:hypothetical protein
MEDKREYVIDPNIQYDVVELPSRGIMYPNRTKSVKVAYLTAADENILSSPNLIASGEVINELLKRKILTKEVPVEDMVEEDRQAILIFLRNTAFGSVIGIKLNDPKTDEEFETEIDLSELSYKEFNLVEDENGQYPYFLDKSKVDVTFKFLTPKDEKELAKISSSWNGIGTAPIVTKRLEKLIRSVKGNTDPMNIRNFIETMPIADSQQFRRYVRDNKPGVDLSRTIYAPSGEEVTFNVNFGVEFFRPFYGL